MMHGIEDSSLQWVINSPDKAPAFQFSRAGFDVWLGNNRGNDFSLGHVKYTSKQKEFWDFDQEQMGLYDSPGFIDYITNLRNDSKLTYVGHSEGTTQFFMGSSLNPDYYLEKVKLFVGLAPIVRLDHSTNSAMVLASQINEPLAAFVQTLGLYNLISLGNTPKQLMAGLCHVFPTFCQLIDDGISPFDVNIDNLDREAVKFAKTPAGSGWRNLIHYA
jgi:lysosomal acid lipase/cholesteryl ester hydrolase